MLLKCCYSNATCITRPIFNWSTLGLVCSCESRVLAHKAKFKDTLQCYYWPTWSHVLHMGMFTCSQWRMFQMFLFIVRDSPNSCIVLCEFSLSKQHSSILLLVGIVCWYIESVCCGSVDGFTSNLSDDGSPYMNAHWTKLDTLCTRLRSS